MSTRENIRLIARAPLVVRPRANTAYLEPATWPIRIHLFKAIFVS